MPMHLKLLFDKSTKNMHRFNVDATGTKPANAALGSIYIAKGAMPKPPRSIEFDIPTK